MRWTVSGELTRPEESLPQPLKVAPAANSQRHVGILGGPRGMNAVRMDDEEVARGGADQQERGVACCSADRCEQLGQRPKDGAIRQVER
jgi:hypothetical protein